MALHRLLLRLYPKSFRQEYGDEMNRVVARKRRDAGGAFGRFWMWVEVLVDTLVSALRVHADILRQDLRHSLRTLRRTPGFAVTAIVVTALGVGATTATFTLTDHVLLRPLPFPAPEQLVKIWQGSANRSANLRGLSGTNDVGPSNYRDWKNMSSSFAAMGAYTPVSSNLIGIAEPERLDGVIVSADTMTILGIQPAIGRTFTAADDQDGAPGTVLLSDGFWHRKFGADPGVLGRTLTLDNETYTVIGVMPKTFEFPSRTTMFWRPIRFGPTAFDDRTDTYLRVIARLKPGVSRQQASADLAVVSAKLAQMYPKENEGLGAVVIGLRDEINDQSRQLLFAMAGASACVLLIACTNLASLLIARATSRGRELAVRTAMGAGRERLVRQLLTESLLIAFVGGAAGFAIAIAAVPMAVRLVPTALPIAEVPAIDLRMLLTAALVTLGTGIGFGVLPAFRAVKQASAQGLRDGARSGSSRRTERSRAALVVAQVAASIVLLVCAGLLIRALVNVQRTDPGFKTAGVLAMRTQLPWEKYTLQTTRTKFYRTVVDDIRALPGVSGAGFVSFLPMVMRGGVWPVALPGRPAPTPSQSDNASARFATPDYFSVMGIPLKRGRLISDSDTPQSQPVAVVSESFGRDYMDGRDPIGTHFNFGPGGERTIVGVVGDVRFRGLERRSEPQVYMAYQQQGDNTTMNYMPKDLVVRASSAGAANALVPAIRAIIARADPQQPISDVRPLSAIIDGETEPRAVQVRVLGAFAAVACLLAAIGLHGLLSFIVSARTREFGVRLALGADRGDILASVSRRGIELAVIGIIVGLGLAYLAGRSMQALLVGLGPADIPTLAISIGIAMVMTLAGSLLPAIRAARIPPTEALRAD
jgi:putative ABC transport system permease protein